MVLALADEWPADPNRWFNTLAIEVQGMLKDPSVKSGSGQSQLSCDRAGRGFGAAGG